MRLAYCLPRLYLFLALTLQQSNETWHENEISPMKTSTAYFLGDALGSVRQLVDGGGRLALARWYDPYGTLASNRGDAATMYGFTGEGGATWTEARNTPTLEPGV